MERAAEFDLPLVMGDLQFFKAQKRLAGSKRLLRFCSTAFLNG